MIALLRVTFGGTAEAEAAARAVIEERLAGCANIEPCRSIYRWQGRIEAAGEVVATFKTLPGLAEQLARRLRDLHAYELPAVEWWAAEATPEVLRWVQDSCR